MVMAALNSCVKDRSTYNYDEGEVITITGINNSYTVLSAIDKLKLTPTATSNKSGANLEYLWGIYEVNTSGASIALLDTIARTKDLDYLVSKPAKTWILVFRVTNKTTGYTAYFTSSIIVTTPFTRGWYIAKDDGTNADMDLFLTNGTIVPDSATPSSSDVYSKVNGAKLSGKAQFLNFLSSYKSTIANGTSLANTRTLFLVTDKDVAAIYISTLQPIRKLSTNLVYEVPDVQNPATIFAGEYGYYFINNGQLHTIYNLGSNTGQFGARVMKNGSNASYRLSKYFLSTGNDLDPFMFDETSSSFLSMSGGFGTVMTPTTDGTGGEMPANNSNKKLLYMGMRTHAIWNTSTGIALFQDITNPSLKILSTITCNYNTKTVTIMNDTLNSASDKIYNATTATVLNHDENLIYFAVGNEIWSRNLSNNFEQLEYAIPAGEELTYLRHKKYTTEAAYAYNLVMIGTKIGSKYKIRMFEKAAGSIFGKSPKITLEGTGIARDVFYVSPSVTENTYTTTF
jgi:hypothetical protein